jgi:hypothetical protein
MRALLRLDIAVKLRHLLQLFCLTHLVLQNEYMRKNGLSGCVVSVSGGIDSAVTYALMMEASKLPGSPIKRTVGIAQPIHSTSSVWRRALELRVLGGEIVTVDQTKLYDDLMKSVQVRKHKMRNATFFVSSALLFFCVFRALLRLKERSSRTVCLQTAS